MNEKIVDILRISDAPDKLYAAQYIEDLHAENERLKEVLEKIYDIPNMKSIDRAEEIVLDIQTMAQQALNEVTK